MQATMNTNSRNATPEKKIALTNSTTGAAAKPKAMIVDRSFNQNELAQNVQQTISNFDDGATTRVKSLSHEHSSTSPHRDASIWQTSGCHSSGQKPPAIPPVLPSKSNNNMTQNIKPGVNPGSSRNTLGSTSAFSMTPVRQLSVTTGGSQNDPVKIDTEHQLAGNNPSLSSVSCSSNDSPDAAHPNQPGLHSRNDSGCSIHSAVRPPSTSNFDPLATPSQQTIFEASALVTENDAAGFTSHFVQNQQRNTFKTDAGSTADTNESSTLMKLHADSSTSLNLLPGGPPQKVYPQHQVQMQIAPVGNVVPVDVLQQPQLNYQQPVPATGSQHQQQQHQQWLSQQQPPQPDLLSSSQVDLNSMLSSMNFSQQPTDPFDELVQTRRSSQSQNPL
jgi:hypothetical protein